MKGGNPALYGLILVAKVSGTWSTVVVIFLCSRSGGRYGKASPEGPDRRALLIDKWVTKS